MFGGRDYSPTELLDVCQVPARQGNTQWLIKILTLFAVERDPEEFKEKLMDIIYEMRKVSIGASLEHLSQVSCLPDELQGGLDGLDALTYHLSASTCEKGIKALQQVLDRFKEEK